MQPADIYFELGRCNTKTREYNKLQKQYPGVGTGVMMYYVQQSTDLMIAWDLAVSEGDPYAIRMNNLAQDLNSNTQSFAILTT